LPKSFVKIVANIDGLSAGASEAVWGADAGRGRGNTAFCAIRSPRDVVGSEDKAAASEDGGVNVDTNKLPWS